MSPRLIWGGALGALVAYDLICDRGDPDGDTLSEVTRDVFHTDTPAGRVRFIATTLGFVAWWLRHILRAARAST